MQNLGREAGAIPADRIRRLMLKKEITYTRIAKRLIKTVPELEYIKDSEVKIVYLSSDEEKTSNRKVILADCRKVNKQYSWCCPYDFMITVYEPNCVDLNEKQMEILLLHELHHVGIDNDGNEPNYYIVPHDIEEFWDIIDQYGLKWQDAGGQ